MSLKPLNDQPAATPTEKEMESWFGMLDDASKADVMKAKIAADADVKKVELASSEFQLATAFRRGVPWVGIVIVSLFASCTGMCVSNNWNEVQKAKIAADHPQPTPPASAAPAASK